jgi:hypothetical protein
METINLSSPKIKAVTIEYLPSEEEMDMTKPLMVGKGLHSNFRITEVLGSRQFFGTDRYLTGLDPEVVKYDPNLTDEEKKAKIEEIQEIVARLENVFGPGKLDAKNKEMWSKVVLTIMRKSTPFNLTDPKQEIIYHCIKAGGFTQVATTIEEAMEKNLRFYLIEPTEFIENRVAPKKLINKAIAELENLESNKSTNDIFFLAKYLLPAEKAYTKRTPKALLYEDLDGFIDGKVVKKSKSQCAKLFLDALKKSKEDLKTYVYLKDAVYFNFVYANTAGELTNVYTKGMYGTTLERAVEHLKNPAYQHELEDLMDRVTQKWDA